jgi:hypothetical protein
VDRGAWGLGPQETATAWSVVEFPFSVVRVLIQASVVTIASRPPCGPRGTVDELACLQLHEVA